MNRIALLALTGCLMVACGGDSTSPANGIVATWSLSTYDGAPLPHMMFQTAAGTVQFIDDAFTFTSDLKYVEIGHVRNTPTNGTPSTTAQGDTGTYTLVNATVTFTSTVGQGVATGTVAGTTMTIIFHGDTLVYVRGS